MTLRRVVEHAGTLDRVDCSERATFLRAGEAPDDGERRRGLPANARAVRAHVDALAAEECVSAGEDSPEVVVRSVPGEAFLAADREADPALLEHAVPRRVLVPARRIRDLGPADEDLSTLPPPEESVRPLTAPELLEDVPGEGVLLLRPGSRAANGAHRP